MQAPSPPNEAERLQALRRYDILDTAPEPEFDDLTFLAALICGTPISAITLVDQERQWFKSRVGLDVPETSRDVSFCAHAILGDDLLHVADASADERFADNPLVMAQPHIRFYAGVPLVTPEGQAVGSLCVVDTVPRELSVTQQDALRRLGRQAVALLEGRPDASAHGQSRQARQNAELQRLTLAADTARRDAENLLFSETRYHRLFEAAKDGILILDAESGQIEDVNPYLCDFLVFEPEDFVGKQLWEIGTFHDIAANKDAFRILQEQEYIRYDDLPLESRDGHRISVEFVSNVYPCMGKDVIQCNIRDISERKRAATAQLESKRFLQSTLDALSSHIAVLDEEGTIIAVNRMWRHFAEQNNGTAASCGVGANYLEVCDQAKGAWTDDAPTIAREIRRAMTVPQADFCLEYPCHSPIEQRWFNVCVTRFESEGLVRVVVAHDDISARKLAELQVIASEANLAAAQQIAHLGSWELDLSNENDFLSNPLRWSDEIFHILGFAPKQFEPSNEAFFESVHPDDRERIRRAMAGAIGGGPPYSVEHRVVLPDGTERVIHAQAELINDQESGRPLKMVGTGQDITRRVQAERALQKANDELELHVVERTAELGTANESLRIENLEHQRTLEFLRQAAQELTAAKEEADQANAAKSEFLSRMSHELRTPLNAILGFGQILENQELTPLSKESVSFILTGGRHLLDLINEILDIARVEAGRLEMSLEPVSLPEAVSEACALVRPLAGERSICLDDNTSTLGADFVLADRQRLKQVLINLLANAIKYNREGGEVEVLCVLKGGGWTSISVRDTGIGIAPADLPKLFTPFERLGASTSGIEGTGLGLVLSRRLVTAMGGTLSVESTLGLGTTFTLELPQAPSPEETLAKTAYKPHDDSPKRATEHLYRVLYIEDNPSNLRLLEVIFQDRPDIAMITATLGSVGLELARDQEPDLILLDLNLPDMHGKEVLARLQQSAITRDIPVIVISADATPNQMKHVLGAGARAYLTKPLNVEQFLRTLDRFRLGSTATLTPINRDKEGV